MRKFDQHFIQEIRSKLDVELIGVTSVETSTSKELKDRATSLLPGVKSVIVVGKEIYKEVVALLEPFKGAGEAERGELLGPHSDYLNGRLTKAVYDLSDLFRKEGYRSLPLPAAGCPVDQRSLNALFSYKHAAQLCGLGTIGRHSLLITPQYGPRVRLASLLTEIALESFPLEQRDYCIDCDACIRECPAKALEVPGQGEVYSMNKFACRTYRQAGLTCSVCMRVCDEVLRKKFKK
jgi:epoxyqueuosine reductase QueG